MNTAAVFQVVACRREVTKSIVNWPKEPSARLPIRFVLTGTEGAGKTTLGRRLSGMLKVELFEVDELPHLLRRTHPLSSEELRSFLAPRLERSDAWILESQLSEVPPEALQRATVIIWLDLPRGLRVWRILRRHGIVLIVGMRSGHGITRRRVLGDIRYAWRSHAHIVAEYERELGQHDIQRKTVRLRDRDAVASWVTELEDAVVSGGNASREACGK